MNLHIYEAKELFGERLHCFYESIKPLKPNTIVTLPYGKLKIISLKFSTKCTPTKNSSADTNPT